MASGARKITVEFLGDDKSLSKTAASVDGKTSKLGSRFAKVGAVAAVGLGAGIALAGKALWSMGKDAEDANRQTAVLTQTFKAMGGAHSAAFKQAVAFSGQLEKSIAVDDGDIQAVQTKLATFGNVWKDPVKGAHNFNRATKLAFDLAAAGFGNAQGNAVQLGKALNDPTKGMSALAKSGVTFTDAEKAKIKKLQESGHLLGAQEILYKAIEGQVGGAAKASVTGTQRMTVAWGEVRETIGGYVLPIMNKLGDWFLDVGLPNVNKFSAYLKDKFGKNVTEVAKIVMRFVLDAVAAFKSHLPEILDTLKNFVDIVKTLWKDFGSIIIQYVVSTWNNVKREIGGALEIISGIFKTVSALLHGDWKGVWDGIKQILHGALQVVLAEVLQVLNMVRALFRVGWKVLGPIVKAAWDGIKNLVGMAWQGIKNLVQMGINGVVAYVRAWFGLMKGLFRTEWNAVKAVVSGAWNGIKAVVTNGAMAIVNGVKAIPGKIRALAGAYRQVGRDLINAFIDGISNAAGFVGKIAGSVWNALKGLINKAIDRINSALNFGINKGPVHINIHAGNIPHLATGGVVKARRGGTLALLGEGGNDEAVIPLSGRYAPKGMVGGGDDISVTAPLVIQLDTGVIWRGLLKMKRANGIVTLGLA